MTNDLAPYVEYHGYVILKNAIDSHITGMKVQFRLRDDNDLDVFKKIVKRRKGHAGQIYRMNYRPIDIDDWAITDVWFLGATWSHNNGATVAFEISDSEVWGAMRSWPATGDGRDVDPKEIEIILFRVGDDGELVNLAQRDHIEEVESMKGGPQSVRAARLSTEFEFRQFVSSQIGITTGKFDLVSSDEAAAWMKKVAGYESRKQLDHDDAKLERFMKHVMSPFNRWRFDNE